MTLWYHICYWLWLPILISGIWLASWLWTNGLFVKKGPCEKEKIDEAAARSRMNSTKSRFEDIDRSKQSADEADKKAHQAQEKADKLKKAAGTRWSASGSTDWEGEHTELHKEGWHNKEAGAKADAAQAEADSARQAADKAKSDFEAKGGSSAWSKAKQDMEEAKSRGRPNGLSWTIKCSETDSNFPANASTNRWTDPTSSDNRRTSRTRNLYSNPAGNSSTNLH
jgi:hypothetical protein